MLLINNLSGDAVVKSTVTNLQTKPTVILILLFPSLYNYAFFGKRLITSLLYAIFTNSNFNEKLGSASAVTQWLPGFKVSFL